MSSTFKIPENGDLLSISIILTPFFTFFNFNPRLFSSLVTYLSIFSSLAVTVKFSSSLNILILTFLPGSERPISLASSLILSISLPSTSVITSPALIPALSAGEFFSTSRIITPSLTSSLRAFLDSGVTFSPVIPKYALSTFPFSINCFITFLAIFTGIAKPMFCAVPLILAVFIPTTSPLIFKRGPPEFPLLIAASVCIKLPYLVIPSISLPFALIIPLVNVLSRPNGLPIAIAQSPILISSELPNITVGKSLSGSIFNTAISISGSVPTTSAFFVLPSESFTTISSALLITWLFVTIYPFLFIIKPEPILWVLLFLSNSRPKNSSNILKKSDLTSTTFSAEILTTAGITFL